MVCYVWVVLFGGCIVVSMDIVIIVVIIFVVMGVFVSVFMFFLMKKKEWEVEWCK